MCGSYDLAKAKLDRIPHAILVTIFTVLQSAIRCRFILLEDRFNNQLEPSLQWC
ncbi:hypothetical protein CROQUDRAFT_650531 [Cronartium quercuum f. sp. fusiforme G11]|uniref:Uncharacterized protein n=1 Tax=Cronartium quercuum f. sp. fusiforme G11 TaxID=708437 RepID=A0A9P6TGY8_9BASI|nr:hypothetical protein CROQUDRAFT_650531 [Cronartium quercuum f. sp. fusiforme G11]